MNKFDKAITATRKFVRTYQTPIAIATTLVVAAQVSRFAVAQRENFMEEKGLLEEFNARYEEN